MAEMLKPWTSAILDYLEKCPRGPELFQPLPLSPLAVGAESVGLSTVAAKNRADLYTDVPSFSEDLRESFRKILVVYGPDSELGMAGRFMMKSIQVVLTNGIMGHPPPGERVQVIHEQKLVLGSVLNITSFASSGAHICEVLLDGSKYTDHSLVVRTDSGQISSLEMPAGPVWQGDHLSAVQLPPGKYAENTQSGAWTSQALKTGTPGATKLPEHAGRDHWLDRAASNKRLRGPYSDRIVDMVTGTTNRRKVSTAFSVDKILARRRNLGNGRLEYLVRWEDCGTEHSTWEWGTTLLRDVPALVLRFEASHPEYPLAVLPDADDNSAGILKLDFCGMRLEVMTDRWTVLDLETKQRHTRPVRHMGTVDATPTATAESDQVPGADEPVSQQVVPYPRSLGSFHISRPSEESKVRSRQYFRSVGLKMVLGADPSPTLPTVRSFSERKELIANTISEWRKKSEDEKAERYYDPVWCCWRS